MSGEYTWYLEPLTQDANETLAAQLDGGWEKSFCRDVPDAQGKPHDLVVVEFRMITFVLKSQNLSPQFRIFNRRGKNGQLRDMTAQVKQWVNKH